jgi:hypothetical protein
MDSLYPLDRDLCFLAQALPAVDIDILSSPLEQAVKLLRIAHLATLLVLQEKPSLQTLKVSQARSVQAKVALLCIDAITLVLESGLSSNNNNKCSNAAALARVLVLQMMTQRWPTLSRKQLRRVVLRRRLPRSCARHGRCSSPPLHITSMSRHRPNFVIGPLYASQGEEYPLCSRLCSVLSTTKISGQLQPVAYNNHSVPTEYH